MNEAADNKFEYVGLMDGGSESGLVACFMMNGSGMEMVTEGDLPGFRDKHLPGSSEYAVCEEGIQAVHAAYGR